MKNILELEGKFWRECSLAMLPTCKLPIKGDLLLRHIWKNTRNECYSLWQFDEAVTIEDTFQYRTLNSTFRDVASSFVPQHLYILSDEEIKEGDWYYNYDYNCIRKCVEINKEFIKNALYYENNSTVFDYSTNCKKIIAATNPELTFESKGIFTDIKYINKLPQIPQSFIQEFIKDKSKSYDEIQLSSNNEVNIIMDNVDDWDEIHNRYLDYIVIHNKQIGVVNLIKWFKLNYNPPIKINK